LRGAEAALRPPTDPAALASLRREVLAECGAERTEEHDAGTGAGGDGVTGGLPLFALGASVVGMGGNCTAVQQGVDPGVLLEAASRIATWGDECDEEGEHVHDAAIRADAVDADANACASAKAGAGAGAEAGT